jgi:hypothetical protein
MFRILSCASILSLILSSAAAAGEWQGVAGNSQHTAQAPHSVQNLGKIHWSTRIDLNPQYSGGELLIHYGSPIVTSKDTVIIPVKTGATDGFRVEALNAGTGAALWTASTDYTLPPHNWTPMFGPQLTPQGRVYFAGAGGTIYYRDTPDSKLGKSGQIAFYGLATYKLNASAYNTAVHIDTPLTSDSAGNIYFGFTVQGAVPNGLVSGIARVGADGTGNWISAAAAAGDSGVTKVQTNAAPAISNDQATVYVAVSNGSSGYLVGLDSATLQPKTPSYKVHLIDPVSGQPSWVSDDSTSSPMVGPDGDVFFGVLESPFPEHNDRGWMLHFDSTLATIKTPGSFGWDDTPSIVPAAAVPSYKGTSNYLIFSKYNNYIDFGIGNGHNEIAVLDPNASQPDEYKYYSGSAANVMKEILTVAGPTAFPGGISGQTYEWCIDSAVVDVATKSIIANSEDGHAYRWSLQSKKIIQSLMLNAPRPEAYTPTVIGVDGKIYAINNAFFYAIGN